VELLTSRVLASHPTPFDPPPELRQRSELEPVSRLRFPDGHIGWLVTGYSAVRAVLADARFSSRPELQHLPLEQDRIPDEPQPIAPGFFSRTDPPEHTRYRRLLAGHFTVSPDLSPRVGPCSRPVAGGLRGVILPGG
jgi:cytochrome P450